MRNFSAICVSQISNGFLSHLENFVLVRLETVEFELEVPEIPERHGFVGRSRSQDKFRVWVEAEAVDLCGVGVYRVGRLVVRRRPLVPDHQLLIVGNRPEQRLVEEMPCNVLDHGSVSGEDCFGINDLKPKRDTFLKSTF